MMLREQLEAQERAWRAFHDWEDRQPQEQRQPERILSDLGTILDWLPVSSRLSDPDPEKLGVRKMFEALRHMSR